MSKEYSNPSHPLPAWAEDDRPREKLILKGPSVLSTSELLAILLGAGTRGITAVALAQQLLNTLDNNLENLSKLSVKDLEKTKGVGPAKAVRIVAALELGRRRQYQQPKTKRRIQASRDAFEQLALHVADSPTEDFWILLLNRSNTVLGKERISQGGVTGTLVDARVIFKKALSCLATSIILCHNHPSGNIQPSHEDISVTRKLKQAGKLLGIEVLDHLIIAGNRYFSFADEGMM